MVTEGSKKKIYTPVSTTNPPVVSYACSALNDIEKDFLVDETMVNGSNAEVIPKTPFSNLKNMKGVAVYKF